jgi:hypothetical protein
MRVSIDKTSVEICESQEYLNALLRLEPWPLSDSINIAQIYRHPVNGQNESKELNLLREKGEFL